MEKICKRCLLRAAAQTDVINDIEEKLKKFPENLKVPKDLYEKRLEICRKCDELLSGMCLKCGCYVEFRAAFKSQKCPYPGENKW